MGNNLPHELSADNIKKYTQTLEAVDRQNGSSSRRKSSATVDEIRELYSALQELVPSKARPQPTSSYGAIPEETGTSRTEKSRVETVEYDVPSRRSDPSSKPAFPMRHRGSSPLPLRAQPKIIQRKRSNSCFVISATPNSLAPRNMEQNSSNSSAKPLRIREEFSNLIEDFGKEKACKTKSDKDYLRADSSEAEESLSKRRYSGGDLLEQRREKLKSPQARMRRRSIGGSLLLNAIIKSDSTQQDSLANALNIIARKDELQEIIKSSEENSDQERKDRSGIGEDLDEVDGPQMQQTPRNPEVDALRSLLKEHQEVGGNSSTDTAVVGAEMHNLLEALQELVITGEGTTPPSSSSQSNSRRTSWVDRPSPKRRESLDELEAFFKNKLEEISEKENEKGSSKVAQSKNAETKTSKSKKAQNDDTKNRFRRSSSAEQYSTSQSTAHSIHRSQSTVEFLSPEHAHRRVGPRRASVQVEGTTTKRSTFDLNSHQSSSVKEKRVGTRLKNFTNRSKRRKSDIPIIRKEEVLFKSKDLDPDEARKRALWKEDQEAFAKQVNQRLQDWLEKATALSLSTAENTEDDNASIDTNPDSAKEDNVKTKRTKFAIKKAFKGRTKRSKSLHNILDLEPEEIKPEKAPKSRSPLIERSKQNLRKLGQIRLPKSISMHNLAAAMKVEQVDAKSIESDESYESSSSNIRRSTTWYDDDSSPEMIPKAVDISGEYLNTGDLSLRRKSCPAWNNVAHTSIDSKRVSRLPVDLPFFYAPEREPSNLRVQKKVENRRHHSSEKENKMPRVCKALFPVRKEIMKNELFYEESKTKTQFCPKPLSVPTTSDEISSSQAKSSCSSNYEEGQFMMFQNYDLSSLSVSNEFESFEDFRDRTKSTESEDSGCPNTSDYC